MIMVNVTDSSSSMSVCSTLMLLQQNWKDKERATQLYHTQNDSHEETVEDNYQYHYLQFRHVSYGIIMPCILALGMLGNSMNIAIFSQKKLWVRQDVMEKSAMIGLISLAIADLLFCVVGFPSAFVEAQQITGPMESTFSAVAALYYTTYRGCMLNVFVFMSTWFIITLSLEKYMAIAHPFFARNSITVLRTIVIKCLVVVMAIAINIPDFLRFSIKYDKCDLENCGCYYAEPNAFFHNTTFAFVYIIIWHILGTFVPLIILAFCNICLLVEIYKSTSHDKNTLNGDQRDPTKITVILISIVTLFFVLVCPSIILSFLLDVVIDKNSNIQHFQIAVVFTNLGQALNFSMNFVLYCVVSPKFRQGLANQTCNKKASVSSKTSARSDNKNKASTNGQSSLDSTCNYEIVDIQTEA